MRYTHYHGSLATGEARENQGVEDQGYPEDQGYSHGPSNQCVNHDQRIEATSLLDSNNKADGIWGEFCIGSTYWVL